MSKREMWIQFIWAFLGVVFYFCGWFGGIHNYKSSHPIVSLKQWECDLSIDTLVCQRNEP